MSSTNKSFNTVTVHGYGFASTLVKEFSQFTVTCAVAGKDTATAEKNVLELINATANIISQQCGVDVNKEITKPFGTRNFSPIDVTITVPSSSSGFFSSSTTTKTELQWNCTWGMKISLKAPSALSSTDAEQRQHALKVASVLDALQARQQAIEKTAKENPSVPTSFSFSEVQHHLVNIIDQIETESLYDLARDRAIEDAKRRGAELAKCAKGRLGRLKSLVEVQDANTNNNTVLQPAHALNDADTTSPAAITHLCANSKTRSITCLATFFLLSATAASGGGEEEEEPQSTDEQDSKYTYASFECEADAPLVCDHTVLKVQVNKGINSEDKKWTAAACAKELFNDIDKKFAPALQGLQIANNRFQFSALPQFNNLGSNGFYAHMNIAAVVPDDKAGVAQELMVKFPRADDLQQQQQQQQASSSGFSFNSIEANSSHQLSISKIPTLQKLTDATDLSRQAAANQAWKKAERYAQQFGLELIGIKSLCEAEEESSGNGSALQDLSHQQEKQAKANKSVFNGGSFGKGAYRRAPRSVDAKDTVSVSLNAEFIFTKK